MTVRISHKLRLLLTSPTQSRRTSRPHISLRRATTSARSPGAITEKSRILEKPARFNPPSHGSRRIRPRSYPGPRLTDEQQTTMKTKRYPNMMPPEGSFMFYFLTDRWIHLWITLGTLTALATYAFMQSFLHTTIYRDQLPSSSDFFSRPIGALRQLTQVYKLHVAHESEVVAQKRRKKLEDADKRKEFLREHGVEPGFLTGGWLDKFGTVEGDEKKERERLEKEAEERVLRLVRDGEGVEGSPKAVVERGSVIEGRALGVVEGVEGLEPKQEKKKLKMWFGIW